MIPDLTYRCEMAIALYDMMEKRIYWVQRVTGWVYEEEVIKAEINRLDEENKMKISEVSLREDAKLNKYVGDQNGDHRTLEQWIHDLREAQRPKQIKTGKDEIFGFKS